MTIPPIGWISAAHRNGVPCFGTLIIEHWAHYSGIDGNKLIELLLANQAQIERIVAALVNLSEYYHFDGWLINIETSMPKDKIPLMAHFLRSLTDRMHQLADRKEARVIWYDSVETETGSLSWQNQLNNRNQLFFDSSDGIFLNYNWDKQMLVESGRLAGERKYDVFVGIDVFGRGCPGGGGFNSSLALQLIREADLSVAIFAPGWNHEVMGHENFLQNEYQFWSRLIDAGLPNNNNLLTELPLRSDFCQGYGLKLFENGQVVKREKWFDLKQQQLQPSFVQLPSNGLVARTNCTGDAFNGGGCLRLSFQHTYHSAKVNLFRTNIELPFHDNHCRLKFTIVYKTKFPSMKLVTEIRLRSGQELIVTLDEREFSSPPVATEKVSSKLCNDWICDEYCICIQNDQKLSYWITSIDVGYKLPRTPTLSFLHCDLLLGRVCLQLHPD